jgi:PAS domain S-box-containing protein
MEEKGYSDGLRISRTTMPDVKINEQSINSAKDDSLLKLLNQNSRELTLILNFEGGIRYSSPAIKKLLGYDPSRVIGKNLQSLIPVGQWVAFRAALRASESEAEGPILIDLEFIDNQDQRQYFSLSVMDQRHHPLVEGYVVNAHSIDRLKRQEEKLKLRNLAIELIQEAVVIVEPYRQKIVYANAAFYELSGFTKSEIMGGKLDLFKPPYSGMLFDESNDIKQVEKYRRAIVDQRRYEARIFSKKKNGKVFYNRLTVIPVMDEKDELTHYIATMKEIKRRKKSTD